MTIKNALRALALKSGLLDLIDVSQGPVVPAQTAAGISVTPASALRVAAVYACVGLLSETIAQLRILEEATAGMH